MKNIYKPKEKSELETLSDELISSVKRRDAGKIVNLFAKIDDQ